MMPALVAISVVAIVRAMPTRSASMPQANFPAMPPNSVTRTADPAHAVGTPLSISRNATKVRKPFRVALSRAAMAPSEMKPVRWRMPHPLVLAGLDPSGCVGLAPPTPACLSKTSPMIATTKAKAPYANTGPCQARPRPVAMTVMPMKVNLPTSPKVL